MILARQRQDLLDEKLSIPTGDGSYIEVTEWHEYEQPDNLDDHEYNAVLYKQTSKGRYAWHRVMSIDLEFKEMAGNRTYIKLWSRQPDQYKIITSDDAIEGYHEYLKAYAPNGPKNYAYGKYSLREVKTLSEWLDTEI